MSRAIILNDFFELLKEKRLQKKHVDINFIEITIKLFDRHSKQVFEGFPPP